MKKNSITLERATEIVKMIALQHGVTEEHVRFEIKQAMIAGMMNPEHQVQKTWKSIPSVGEIPTIEELILWAVNKME